MADPIITDHFRVLAVLHRDSGLAEDQVVNSWAFRNDGVVGNINLMLAAVSATLQAFYVQLVGFLAPDVASLEFRMYDLGQAPPRTPHVNHLEPFAGGASTGLPAEVACCLSMKTADRSPRGRGRVFLGPLGTNVMDDTTGVPRPTTAFRETMRDAAENVRTTSQDLTWVIISQLDAEAKVVTGGFIDDAFDTIRSRGHAPTQRTVFPPVAP